MENPAIPLAKQVNRVPSMTVQLGPEQQARFDTLMEDLVMVDLHQHPMVCSDDMGDFIEYLRGGVYEWGYQAAKVGGWSAVATANCFSGMVKSPELSYISFEDLVEEIGLMLANVSRNPDVVLKVTNADDILAISRTEKVGFLPTVEHLAIGDVLNRIDVLFSLGVRVAGLTYNYQNSIGCGLVESKDSGLTDFGRAAVDRMNDLGVAVDVSHAGYKTAMDAIKHSKVPITFSHNAAHTLRPTWRTRNDDELVACAKKGGLIAVTAVPNSLSDDPKQDISCVLDHYDYLVNLVGIDHVGIGTDTLIGDHVGYHVQMMGRNLIRQTPAPYLDGLESPADGKNIIRGLITRGYKDAEIRKIAGENALSFLRRVTK
jgi:membrane dipeptidase